MILRVLGSVLAGLLACGLPLWDPTSHNPWPIEVMIAGVIGLAAALAGVGLARLLQRPTAK